jgi:hypothetical protein|tara:strand:- start:252 stop:353 length:102 start_codon:yes stop_codon:yes gene_type:complete
MKKEKTFAQIVKEYSKHRKYILAALKKMKDKPA